MRNAGLILTAAVIATSFAACKGPNNPTGRRITAFITGIKTVGTNVSAVERQGSAPAAQAGGPSTSISGGASAVSGSANSYGVTGSTPFQKVFVSVSSSGAIADGHFELSLPSPVATTTLEVSFSNAIPQSQFAIKFQTANAAGVVGAENNINTTVVTSIPRPTAGTSITANGALRLAGLGADGTGRGTGFYNVGTCSNDGANTTCVVTGTYTETAGSQPGSQGTYTMTMTYAGTSPTSPAVVRSSAQDPNSVGFIDPNLNGALFVLTVSPSYGGVFSESLPPFPPNGMGFFAALAPGATCTGTSTCTIATVALTPGAVLTGSILQAGFSFTFPQGGGTARIR
jgi:hypothetical protein